MSLWRDRSSVAALEFAIILPLMLILLAGVYDLSEVVIIRAEVYAAAQTMAASASSLAVQSDGSTALYYDQVQQVESTIWGLVPSLASGQKVQTPISITLSSVRFFPSIATACVYGQKAPSCNYNADVVWSESYVGAGTGAIFDYIDPTAAMKATGCAQIYQTNTNQVSASTPLTGYDNVTKFRTYDVTTSAATALPTGSLANDAGIAPILAVAIQYTYRPLFSLYLSGPYTFWVDAYWPVRSVKAVAANTTNYGNGNTTEEPLSLEYTTLLGSPTTNTPTGTDLNAAAYCINPSQNPVTAIPTS